MIQPLTLPWVASMARRSVSQSVFISLMYQVRSMEKRGQVCIKTMVELVLKNVSGPQAEERRILKDQKMLLRSLNKNSISILLVKQTSKLSIFQMQPSTSQRENISLITSQIMILFVSMLTLTTHQTLPRISTMVYQSEYINSHLTNTFSTAQNIFITTL